MQAQETRIRAFAEAMGRPIDVIVTDSAISAKTTRRPGLKRILDGVRSDQIASVVVLKIDRLTRSIRDLNNLLELFSKHGVAFASVQESLDTGSAAGRMITNVLGVLAQFEREQIAERTAFALAYKRGERQVYGHAAFGWKREGDAIVPVPEQQKALTIIQEMDRNGVSYRRIGQWLRNNGFAPPQGGREWYAASVRKMLCSRMVTGT